MTLTITLEPEVEARFREEAIREGLTIEQLTAHRLLEAELLWRIRTAVPEPETRLLHRLLGTPVCLKKRFLLLLLF